VFCGTKERLFAISLLFKPDISLPSSMIVPCCGFNIEEITLSSVLLPEPLGPTILKNFPFSIFMLMDTVKEQIRLQRIWMKTRLLNEQSTS
jgi:hypothetical protein